MGVSALWWGLTLGLFASSGAYVVLLLGIDWAEEAKLALYRSTIGPDGALGDDDDVLLRDKTRPLLS